MVSNRYRLKLKEKVWQRQIKQCSMQQRQEQEQDVKTLRTSHIAHTVGISCTFRTPSTQRGLYIVKDSPDSESQAHAVYLVKCRSCQEEDVGKMMRAVSIRQIEHCDAIRLGYVSKSAVADEEFMHEID